MRPVGNVHVWTAKDHTRLSEGRRSRRRRGHREPLLPPSIDQLVTRSRPARFFTARARNLPALAATVCLGYIDLVLTGLVRGVRDPAPVSRIRRPPRVRERVERDGLGSLLQRHDPRSPAKATNAD